MASLEDCLRNFAKAGSGFAFPSARFVVLETFGATTTAGERKYIPPADGYISLYLNATSGTVVEAYARYTCQQLSSHYSGQWARCCVPCKKGSECLYRVLGAGIIQGQAVFVYSEGSQ